MKLPIYLDNNATTPMDPRVLEAMTPYFLEHYGNAASRNHPFGWQAEEAVDYAREQVAKLIGADPKEIIFTSGATEGDNLAIKGVYEMYASKGNHIITATTEHKAVLDTCKHLEKLGADVTYLEVDAEGNISLENLEKAIKKETILISVMAANNETGVIYPIKQIAEIAHRHGVLFHSDATQAVGKMQINVIEDEIDLLNFSGHKLYGPKGVGVLYLRKKLSIIAQQDGGKHERGMRSGTLNVTGIVGLGEAAEICQNSMSEEADRLSNLRNKLENGILEKLPNTKINGNIAQRLPNTTNICFGKIDGEQLLMNLNKIAVSNGSACNSASTEPSYVLKAMGLDDESAYNSVRFSLGRMTQESDIELAIEHVLNVVEKMIIAH